MRTIGIKEFETLVRDRLENPQAYIGKSLVLWNYHLGPDDIAYYIIKRCCVCYNQDNPKDMVWYVKWCCNNPSILSVSKEGVVCDRKDMYGFKKHGILINDGIIFSLKASEEQVSDWIHFVNTHEYKGEQLSDDWALIAVANADRYGFKESDFSANCEIVSVQPSVDEWAELMMRFCPPDVLNPIVSFIKQNDDGIDLYYWGVAVKQLAKLRIKDGYEFLYQIPSEVFCRKLRSFLALKVEGFPYTKLWEFVQSYKR